MKPLAQICPLPIVNTTIPKIKSYLDQRKNFSHPPPDNLSLNVKIKNLDRHHFKKN